ncbi:TetR/AcrR family transcriptional regulator C-terminal ligand-binding domain-containing protein [Streptomyces roseolus]|uniref:TetR/AcrR family transcriptional regulator C-terminal ligand-binding domain-containing protein n=1 Tax=Streptomyces roseolus TaxID=67358 RepID=UPI0033D2CA8F
MALFTLPGPQTGAGGREAPGTPGPRAGAGGPEASGAPGREARGDGAPERGALSDGPRLGTPARTGPRSAGPAPTGARAAGARRDDLVTMPEFMRRRGLAKRSSALLRNVFTQMQAYPRLWEQYHRTATEPRRSRGIEVLRRGVGTGEVRAGLDLDLDLVDDLFIGTLLLRTVLPPDADLAPDFPARVADAILDGVRPRD